MNKSKYLIKISKPTKAKTKRNLTKDSSKKRCKTTKKLKLTTLLKINLIRTFKSSNINNSVNYKMLKKKFKQVFKDINT